MEKFKIVKIVAVVGTVIAVAVLVFTVLSGRTINLSSNPQSALVSKSLNTNVAQTPPGVPVPISNAVIIDQYLKHVENFSVSCRDESKCSANSTNSSGMNSYTTTARTPYAFAGGRFDSILQYREFSGNEVFTPAFGERYGITGRTYAGFFNEKTYEGSETRTATGPKGNSNTQPVLHPPANFRTDLSDNVKGSDTSGNWTDVRISDGDNGQEQITNNGIWEQYSYSGDSKKYLMMKGRSDRTYTVTLSLGANTWRLNTAQDHGRTFYPRYFINGEEIGCGSIKVMGKTLDRNCRVAISVSGGGVYDITPAVNAPRYLYSQPLVLSIADTTPPPTSTTSE